MSEVFFGVVLELDGKEISLQPKNAITQIAEKGIEVELPPGEQVALGTVGERLKGILTALGIDANSDSLNFINDDGTINAAELPDIPALQRVVNVFSTANLAIEEFHLRLPATGKPTNSGQPSTTSPSKSDTAYTVGLSATWIPDPNTGNDPGQLIDGLDLSLRGLYFKVSNEEG